MYKKKFEKSKTLVELRSRQSYTKPSVVRSEQVFKAVYKGQMAAGRFDHKGLFGW